MRRTCTRTKITGRLSCFYVGFNSSAAAVSLAASFGSHDAQAQGVFTLSSPSFKDGERLAAKNAGNNKSNPNCVGRQRLARALLGEPAGRHQELRASNVRPRGPSAGGVSHWVAYGIPASVTGFAEGEVSKASDKYVGGTSLMKLSNYFGPCTPPGPQHHIHLHADGDRSRTDRTRARPDP